MGTPNYWRPTAAAINHTFTITFTATATGTGTATITIGTKTVTQGYVNTDTVAIVAAALAANLQASAIPEFAEVEWTYPSTGGVITGVVKAAGVPVEVSASVTAATGISVAKADTVAPSGPNFVSIAANFSLGLPVNGQDVIVDGGTPDMLYGFASSGWTGAPDFYTRDSFAGAVGLPRYNTSGGTPYLEYRRRYITLPGALAVVGIGDGSGSGPSRFVASLANGSVVRIFKSGPTVDGEAAVQLVPTTSVAFTLYLFGGSCSIGFGESVGVTGTTVTLAEVDGANATLIVGPYVTVTATVLNAGDVTSLATNTTTTIRGSGSRYTQEDGSVVNLNVYTGGTATLNQQQTGVTDITLTMDSLGGDAPTLDLSKTRLVKDFTNGSVKGGSVVNDPAGVGNYTIVSFDNESAKASTVGTGYSITVAPL